MAKTPYVVNWDADVLVDPHKIELMIRFLRTGWQVCYPYDGRFLLVPRSYIAKIQDTMTVNALQYVNFQSMGATSVNSPSYGGAVGYNKEAFISVGGENENFISMGAEDQERWRRFNLLLKVARVDGPLYHINHHRGVNSTFKHENGRANQLYWDKLCRITDAEFIEHIKTFTWLK
jgi:predicted glycosyltransferase involved in capsule biosynthesis